MNFFPPSPQPPSPVGKGVILGLFRRGLPPPAPLRLNPGGAGAGGGVSRADGGLAPTLPDNPAIAVPDEGGGGFGRRLNLPHHKFLAPIPPTRARRALFPRGEGGDFWFISPGATAPGTPAPEPERRGGNGGVSCADGGLAPALPDNPAVAVPDGGRRFRSPAESAAS